MTSQALEGIKVAEFAWVGVGPRIGKYLADNGATVIRIESAARPDLLRTQVPYKDNVPGLNRAGAFTYVNTSKYSMGLNMSHPKAIHVAERLVKWADVVTESFTPGIMARWGLDYDNLKRIKANVIMLSTCNQGQSGPHAKHPGYGAQLVALSGFTQNTGWPDRLPTQPFGAYTDYVAPRFGTAALVAALDYRRRTGKGQYLDLSQLESGIHFLAPLILQYTVSGQIPQRQGNSCLYAAPHGVYRCKGNDRWCAIAVFTDEEWESFCNVIGKPEWTHDARFTTLLSRKENEDDLDRLVEAWTVGYTAEETMSMMQKAGIGSGIVKNIKEVYEDQQLSHRGSFWSVEHPEMGSIPCEANGFLLSKTPGGVRRPPPCLGQHTEYVCREVLGMSEDEFVAMLKEGVFE